MTTHPTRKIARVLSSPIDVINWDDAVARVSTWADHHDSRYVCFCNVHSIVIADLESAFSEVIARSDMTVPDGAPIVWMLRLQGYSSQERINGPDFMWRYLALAESKQEPVYFYGSAPHNLAELIAKVRQAFPNINIVGSYSPPFRALTLDEDEDIINNINASGAKTLWVSLGCPKQEAWMAAHRGQIQAVMLGVGAAFNYHSGQIKRPPLWMQRYGLEWWGRLWTNPLLLWRRYLVTNLLFLWSAAIQLWKSVAFHG